MDLVTIDFETAYGVDGLGFGAPAKQTTEQYVRDPNFEIIGVAIKVNNGAPKWYSFDNEADYKTQLAPLMGGFVLAHNAMFDGAILNWRLGLKPKFWLDTLSMARPLHGATVGGSLKNLAIAYDIGQKGDEVVAAAGKYRKDFTHEELAAYGAYCRNDVELTYKLFHLMKGSIPKQELQIIDLMVRMFTEPVIRFDTAVLRKHLAAVLERKQQILSLVEAHCSQDDLMSNQKFATVLRKFGVEPPMKTNAKGEETYAFAKTDVAFKALLDHEDDRVQAVVGARLGTKSTIEESRTKTFLGISERGPLPIMLNYYGAHTGRASGGDDSNLQNLPRGGALRKSVIAPPGHVFVASDSSQIEARVTAWLAEEDDLVAAFGAGSDIYSEFATEVYGYKVEKATHKIERHVGKTCILGLGYGMGKDKFKMTLKVGNPSVDMDINNCERIVKLYRRKYRKIVGLWSQGSRALEAIRDGERYEFGRNNLLYTSEYGVHLPNGMIVRYPELMQDGNEFSYMGRRNGKKERIKIYGGKVIENVVQALARIIVFDQMLTISKRYKVVLTVHDEVVTAVPEDLAETAKSYMLEVMHQAPAWGEGLPIAAEAGVGESYGGAK